MLFAIREKQDTRQEKATEEKTSLNGFTTLRSSRQCSCVPFRETEQLALCFECNIVRHQIRRNSNLQLKSKSVENNALQSLSYYLLAVSW